VQIHLRRRKVSVVDIAEGLACEMCTPDDIAVLGERLKCPRARGDVF
jgi:hypothetical protein